MKQIKFLGAAGEVTGSAFLLSDDYNQQILIDLGMFQGNKEMEEWNYRPLEFNPRTLDAVILTHAHLDHCGRLPLLIKGGFSGPIFMTRATRSLIEIVLLDSAKVSALNNPDHIGLYTDEEIGILLSQAEIHECGEEFKVGTYEAKFHDAGHILGSAFVELTDPAGVDGEKTIIFSGDLGNSPEDLVKPTEVVHQADIVVMESTYGDKLHPKEDKYEIIKREINAVEWSSGVLLIPSFSIDRTQTILHVIDHLKKNGQIRRETPVFMDSPMASRVTQIYEKYKYLYGKELAAHAHMDDPFQFPGLSIVHSAEQSKHIDETPGPKVIIAGNGMMQGGRILHHAAKYLPNDKTRLLIVGFQAQETIGRAILEGADMVTIEGQEVPVNATISEAHSMSAHADQDQLMDWLKNIQGVRKLFLVHGEDPSRAALTQKVSQELNIPEVISPGMNEECTVGQG